MNFLDFLKLVRKRRERERLTAPTSISSSSSSSTIKLSVSVLFTFGCKYFANSSEESKSSRAMYGEEGRGGRIKKHNKRNHDDRLFFYKKWKLKNKCLNKEREEINDQKEKILPGRFQNQTNFGTQTYGKEIH